MTILSVDLASRRYQDIGIAVIDYLSGIVRARIVKPRHTLLAEVENTLALHIVASSAA